MDKLSQRASEILSEIKLKADSIGFELIPQVMEIYKLRASEHKNNPVILEMIGRDMADLKKMLFDAMELCYSSDMFMLKRGGE